MVTLSTLSFGSPSVRPFDTAIRDLQIQIPNIFFRYCVIADGIAYRSGYLGRISSFLTHAITDYMIEALMFCFNINRAEALVLV